MTAYSVAVRDFLEKHGPELKARDGVAL
jgi:hypothetical protein